MFDIATLGRVSVFNIVVASSVAFVFRQLLQSQMAPDGFVADGTVSKVLTWRFFAAFASIPLTVGGVIVVNNWIGSQFNVQPMDMADQLRVIAVGIIICVPAGLGIALFMQGAPWLEPRLTPIRRYITVYLLALILLNLIFALTPAGQSTFAIEVCGAILIAIAFVFPHAILIGTLQLLANTSILLQYALWQHTDITAYVVIPMLAFATIMLMTARTSSQSRMNTLIHKTQEQGILLNTFVRNGPHYFLVEDENYKILEISEAFAQDILGTTADQAIGSDLLTLRNWDADTIRDTQIRRRIEDQQINNSDTMTHFVEIARRDGKPLQLRARVHPIHSKDGHIDRRIVFEDLTELQTLNRELRERAYIDPLTRVSNRLAFLSHYAAPRQKNYILLLVHLDSLRTINSAYSTEIGDLFLKSFARQMERTIESGDRLFRLSGETFVIVTEMTDAQQTEQNADRIHQALNAFELPFDGTTVHSDVSIGIVEFADHQNLDDVMNLCDLTIQETRKRGGSVIVNADANFIRLLDSQGAFFTLRDIEQGLNTNQFYYRMRPIVDLRAATVCAVDITLQWRRAENEHIPKSTYFPLLTEYLATPARFSKLAQMWPTFSNAASIAGDTQLYLHTGPRLGENLWIQKYFMTELQRLKGQFGVTLACPGDTFFRMKRPNVLKNLHQLRDIGAKIALDVQTLEVVSFLDIVKHPIDEIILNGTLIEDITNDHRLQEQAQIVVNLGIEKCMGDYFAPDAPACDYAGFRNTLTLPNVPSRQGKVVTFKST